MAALQNERRETLENSGIQEYPSCQWLPFEEPVFITGCTMEDQREPSVWNVTFVTLAIFAAFIIVGGMFGGTETAVAVATN